MNDARCLATVLPWMVGNILAKSDWIVFRVVGEAYLRWETGGYIGHVHPSPWELGLVRTGTGTRLPFLHL